MTLNSGVFVKVYQKRECLDGTDSSSQLFPARASAEITVEKKKLAETSSGSRLVCWNYGPCPAVDPASLGSDDPNT